MKHSNKDNANDEVLKALKRILSIHGTGNGNEPLCYCDDYIARDDNGRLYQAELCEFCQAYQAVKLAEGK